MTILVIVFAVWCIEFESDHMALWQEKGQNSDLLDIFPAPLFTRSCDKSLFVSDPASDQASEEIMNSVMVDT